MMRATFSFLLVLFISLWPGILYMKLPQHSSGASTEIHSLINTSGNILCTRFNPPPGFERKEVAQNSFAFYLRHLPLHEDGYAVHYFDGQEKNMLVYDAVVNMDIGKKNLQQCADIVMRLRGEYFFSQKQYENISFRLTNGFRMEYSEWMKGNRLTVDGNKTKWVKSASPSNTYTDFSMFMDVVFNYAGTASLSRSLHPKNISDIAIGDVFVHGGFPGHAVIVVDVAENKSGQKVFLIAQGYMPAQEIHVLKNYSDDALSPWYSTGTDKINSPQWTFDPPELMSFD